MVALDMAPGMLREAQKRQHFFRRFERVCSDAMRLPFADSSVDVVFSSLMLQWCDPLDVAFAEVRRVLKPTGSSRSARLGLTRSRSYERLGGG